MSAIVILKKEHPKKRQIFHFFKWSIFDFDVNVGVFWEPSVGFLKSVVLQLFPKYNQSYANLNVKSRPKFNNS